MRAKFLLATFAALLGLATGWLLGHRPAKDATPAEAPAPDTGAALMPPPRKPDLASVQPARVPIPSDSIYCATGRKGELRIPTRKDDAEFDALWERLRTRLRTLAFRTAFVVQVPTIHGAVEDTLDVLTKNEGGESFLLSPEWGRKAVWAVVFLGNMTTEQEVAFTSATYATNELILTVRISRNNDDSVGVAVPRMYWVPLPEVRPGLLTLRLHDSEMATDLLVNRIVISEELQPNSDR